MNFITENWYYVILVVLVLAIVVASLIKPKIPERRKPEKKDGEKEGVKPLSSGEKFLKGVLKELTSFKNPLLGIVTLVIFAFTIWVTQPELWYLWWNTKDLFFVSAIITIGFFWVFRRDGGITMLLVLILGIGMATSAGYSFLDSNEEAKHWPTLQGTVPTNLLASDEEVDNLSWEPLESVFVGREWLHHNLPKDKHQFKVACRSKGEIITEDDSFDCGPDEQVVIPLGNRSVKVRSINRKTMIAQFSHR